MEDYSIENLGNDLDVETLKNISEQFKIKNMNKKLDDNHSAHLRDLKQQIIVLGQLLKKDDLSEQEHEALSQGNVISQMMFECGMKAFIR